MKRGGCVYITTNQQHTALYTGVSSNLLTRIYDHKHKTYPNSYAAKYNCNVLVYYLFYPTIEEAITAEKLIKGGSRQSKINLINGMNLEWKDLYDGLLEG